MRKKRLFVDLDGTLAEFKKTSTSEMLYEKGYFLNLRPLDSVVGAIKEIIRYMGEYVEVFTLSAVLSDSPYALDEKKLWLSNYLSEISRDNQIFLPCGKDKTRYIPGGVAKSDFLLDDYTLNLNQWDSQGYGIKLLNGINHTNGTWEGDRIRFDKSPGRIAEDILRIISGIGCVYDERPFI